MSIWLDRVYREVDAAASRTDQAESPARRALLTGVFLSAGVLVLGLVLTFAQREPRPNDPPAIAEILRDLVPVRGVALLYIGLLFLAATPILRVVVMVRVYLRRREWFMVVVSLVVLGLLAIGILLGAG
jgi:uncharacterized membrane protein